MSFFYTGSSTRLLLCTAAVAHNKLQEQGVTVKLNIRQASLMENTTPRPESKLDELNEDTMKRFILLMRTQPVKHFALQCMPETIAYKTLLQCLVKLFESITPENVQSMEGAILIRNVTVFFAGLPPLVAWINDILSKYEDS